MVSKQPLSPHPSGPGNQQDRNALLQAYLAEYQAITTRNTYWLTLQYALFPILGAAVAVLAQMWNQFGNDSSFGSLPHRIIIWLVIVLANVIMIAHTEVGWESYDNVVYLETELRPKIVSLTGVSEKSDETPLGYETYKNKLRGKGPKWWELPAPGVSLVLLGLGLYLFAYLYPWTRIEWVAAGMNFLLFLQTVRVAVKMIRRRQDIGSKRPTKTS